MVETMQFIKQIYMEEILKKYKDKILDNSKYSYIIFNEEKLIHFFRVKLGGNKKIHLVDSK